MKILLIEDDPNKAEQIKSCISEFNVSHELTHRNSYQSGLKELYDNNFDLVLLDMSLPTYDIVSGEDAYKFRHLAGYEILQDLKRKSKSAQVIIITQFERFGEGKQYISLVDLRLRLRQDFKKNYLEIISYHPNMTLWKDQLKKYIQNA